MKKAKKLIKEDLLISSQQLIKDGNKSLGKSLFKFVSNSNPKNLEKVEKNFKFIKQTLAILSKELTARKKQMKKFSNF